MLEGLNEQQIKAVTFGTGPLLIIAGAGTGKTTVLTRRIAWLIENELAKPDEILALTFTDKAALEMEERVDLLMPLGLVDIEISTFHAFAHKILYQHALDIGLPGDFKILTDTQAWMLVKSHLSEFSLDYYRPLGNPNKFIHALLKHFGKAKGEEITPEQYLKYAEDLKLGFDNLNIKKKARKKKTSEESPMDESEVARIFEVANAYHQYQKLLLDNSYLDFGDLINFTLKLFKQRPKILASYQSKFKYILVDEFQDTDLSQYELVKMLSYPANNITVVGDDDQSIYKFRGASVSNILKFKEDYKNAKEITLVDNYRSTQNILDLSYKFIQQNNPERLEAKLGIVKKLKSHNRADGSIKVLHAKSSFDEARLVADKITELSQTPGLTFNDIAILVRANDHAEPFINELNKRGVPYIFVANRGLYKKPFILDVLAYFRLLDNYHESENLFRVLNMPKFKIADDDIILISQTAKRRTLSMYEVLKETDIALKLPEDTQNKISELRRLLSKHTALAREIPVSELLVRTLDELGTLKNLSSDSLENSENRNLLDQLYKKCLAYEEGSDDKTVKGFLNFIRLELEAGDAGELNFNPDAGPEAVRIMTVHSAKGLEFTCVFVANLVEQRFPSRERKEQIEVPQALVREILPEGDVHLMEERRLFYVALTRAKQNVFLTWADDYGGSTHKKPSKFLIELGLEQEQASAKASGEVFFVKQPTLPKLAGKLILPDTFSFSQISCFLHCPLEYKYKYVYHLPLPGAAPLSFGQTIHKTLEKFLQNVLQLNSQDQQDLFGSGKKSGIKVPDREVLHKLYVESWVDDWYADKIQKELYRKDGVRILDSFYERYKKDPKIPKFLEKSFKLKLGNYKFVGKIDRADQNSDGTIDIIDYKTGQERKKLSPVDKQQLLIYQWAASEEFKEKVRSLRYWYLGSTAEAEEFLGSSSEIEEVKQKLIDGIGQIIESIKAMSFRELDLKTSHDCKYRHLQ